MSKLETNFLTSEERLSLIRDHKLEKDGRKRDRMKFILLYNDMTLITMTRRDESK